MTIKQHGGIFGRNPTFNDVTVNDLTAGSGSSIEGSGSSVTFSVDRTDASTDGALVFRAAASSLSIDSDGANKDILIRTGGSTERARFYGDNGNFSIKGNLIVQTSGSGIDFSATSGTGTSELFDDYEEGTWTPVATSITINSGTPSWSGKYTKIGRTVLAEWALSGGANIDVSLSSYLSLPFTASGYSWGTYGNVSTNTHIGGMVTFSSSLYFGTAASGISSASGTILFQV